MKPGTSRSSHMLPALPEDVIKLRFDDRGGEIEANSAVWDAVTARRRGECSAQTGHLIAPCARVRAPKPASAPTPLRLTNRRSLAPNERPQTTPPTPKQVTHSTSLTRCNHMSHMYTHIG